MGVCESQLEYATLRTTRHARTTPRTTPRTKLCINLTPLSQSFTRRNTRRNTSDAKTKSPVNLWMISLRVNFRVSPRPMATTPRCPRAGTSPPCLSYMRPRSSRISIAKSRSAARSDCIGTLHTRRLSTSRSTMANQSSRCKYNFHYLTIAEIK